MRLLFSFILTFILSITLDAKDIKSNTGSVSGQIRAMYLIDDLTNTFTPRNGSAYLLKLKYVTPTFADNFKLTTAVYINGDTGLTDFEDASKKKALGMFLREEGKVEAVLGEAYLEYKADKVIARVGRQRLDTPLTKIAWSFVPFFYESAFISLHPTKKLSTILGHISALSYGTREAADFGLIGEKTGTAGTVRPMSTQSDTGINRGDFINVGEAAGVAKTKGTSLGAIKYKLNENFKVSIWDFYSHDIANSLYIDMNYKFPLANNGVKLSFDAQYLYQTQVGGSLVGDLDFSLYGFKVKLSSPDYSLFAAINKSGDGGEFFNAWGSDPGYTSSIFSRNEYRKDVTAYKLGFDYKLLSNLQLVVSYANYGKSKTQGWGSVDAQDDATAINTVILYKPVKQWLLKIFNVRRTSEYNTPTTERKMNQYRFITNYVF